MLRLNRRAFIRGRAALLAASAAAEGQSAARLSRIGFVTGGIRDPKLVEALERGLCDLGYENAKDIIIDYRFADGNYERLPGLLAELVRLNAD